MLSKHSFYNTLCVLLILFVCRNGAFSKRSKKGLAIGDDAKAAIFSLIETGNIKEIRKAIKENKTLAAVTGKNGETLLMTAIKAQRDRSIVSYLLEVSDISAQDYSGQTAIFYAMRYLSDKKVIKDVITARTSLFERAKTRLLSTDNEGTTAYELSFENPSPVAGQVAKKYLSKKDIEYFSNKQSQKEADELQAKSLAAASDTSAEPNAAEKDANSTASKPTVSPAESAISIAEDTSASPDIAEQQSVADSLAPYAAGTYTPKYLYEYAASPDEEDKVEAKDFISDANKADKNGFTRLMSAAKKGNEWEVTALLNSGANVNSTDKDGWSALMYAARYHMNGNIVSALLDAGADASLVNNYGFTSLSIAAAYNENPIITESILEKFSAGDNEVFRSFIAALTAPSSEEVRRAKTRAFLEYGVPLNRYWEGKTPLMYAASSCRGTDVLSMLLDNGAIASLTNAEGKKAFDYAKENVNLPHDEVYWKIR